MASETTQAGPAARAAAAGALDPGALFTLEEAAGRVRVPIEDLEARCDRGELLFETRRRGRQEVRCVRGLDLAEAFPGAPDPARSLGKGRSSGGASVPDRPSLGGGAADGSNPREPSAASPSASPVTSPGSPKEPSSGSSLGSSSAGTEAKDRGGVAADPGRVQSTAAQAAAAQAAATQAAATQAAATQAAATQATATFPASGPRGSGPRDSGNSVAEAVRSSGASRDALIGLCQDLETRLDLAERERQASTASLLMAQRHVLDLELRGRSGSWVRAGGAALGLMSVSALVVMAMLPGWLDDRAAGREALQGAQLTAEIGRLEASMGSLAAASDEERAALSAQLEARTAQLATRTESLVAERRLALQAMADAAAERERAEEVRLANIEQLNQLEERLVASDRQAVRRSAELGVIVESSARDRARFDERLAAAERSAGAARDALSEARARSAEERRRYEDQLAAAEAERAAQHAARAAEAQALRAEIRGLMAELELGQTRAVAALEAAEARLLIQMEDRTTSDGGVSTEVSAPGAVAASAAGMPLPEGSVPVEVWDLPEAPAGSWWTRALRSMVGR